VAVFLVEVEVEAVGVEVVPVNTLAPTAGNMALIAVSNFSFIISFVMLNFSLNITTTTTA
jgi:hypothetical protein